MQPIRTRLRALSPADRARYHSIADQYDSAWLSSVGSPPDLDSYLPPDEPLRTLLLVALARTDLEARRRRKESIQVEDYLSRHPELKADDSAQVDLISWEYELSLPEGARPEDYCERFPNLAKVLRPLLTRHAAPLWTAPPGYADLKEIGRGGMGTVYLARDERLKRRVALKVLSATLATDLTALARFRREAEIVAALHHPNIVEIYEVGEHQGQPYCALEYCPGGSLHERLQKETLESQEAAQLLATLARAVQAAHEKGVIHRDLKPANVLTTADGTPRLADFGLARKLDETGQTQTGAIIGTAGYMAPEQAQGKKEIGPAADVYALGAILYETLTGRPPFRSATTFDTLLQVLEQEPVPPRQLNARVARDLETICLKCLEKDPRKRYASAAALADDLERYREGKPIQARRASFLEQGIKWARRRPAAALALVFAVATPTAIAAVALGYNVQLAAQTRAANIAREAAELRKQQTLRAADVLVDEVARGVEPIAGTRSAEVRQILAAARRVYDDLLTTDSSPEVLAGNGRLHDRFAAIYLQMNDSTRAQQEADAGRAVFERLLADDRTNRTYRAGLADSHEQKGRAVLVRDDLAAALAEFTACRDLRAALVQEDENNTDQKATLANAYVWIGTVLQAQGKVADATADYNQALKLRRQWAGPGLKEAPPDRQRAVADAHERLGNLALENSRLAEAADHYRQAMAVLKPLADADKLDTPGRKSSEKARIFLAQTLLRSDPKQALALLEAAFPHVERGMLLDPDDLDWQRMWFSGKAGLNLAEMVKANTAAARAAQVKAWQQLQSFGVRLVKKDPRNRILQADVAAVEMALAAVHYLRGNAGEKPAEAFTEAVKWQSSAVQRLEALAEFDPSNKEWARGFEEARKFLDVLEMRKNGATAPKLPGLTDPEYLQVARSTTTKDRDKFKRDPTPATAENFALSCSTLADLLRKGDYGPYLVEARKWLTEGRDALKTGTTKMLSDRQKDVLADLERQLRELARKKDGDPKE